jgi:hypothetical protein
MHASLDERRHPGVDPDLVVLDDDRDEFYYLGCRKRMAWGYVDQPPLSIAVHWIVTRVFGDSLVVLRSSTSIDEIRSP